jgi:5-methylcytosine-specific restriction endonuclease McrA
MPVIFMNNAEKIRKELLGINEKLLETKKSNYNSLLFMDVCQICNKNKSEETHHINYQSFSDDKGYFENFHKNSKHNLVNICKECHDKEHSGVINIEGYKQSTIKDKESLSWKKSQADIAKSADKSVNSVTNETQPTNTITQQSATADQMQQAINNNKETNKIIDKTQKSLDDNTESLKNLTSTTVNQTNGVKEDLTINIDKVKVNLDKLESNLLTGINSIKATMQNVNFQVAVAVELNVADLEKAIVRQNSSLIRKAVQIIENNLPSNPNTEEKSGEAKIVTAAVKGAGSI